MIWKYKLQNGLDCPRHHCVQEWGMHALSENEGSISVEEKMSYASENAIKGYLESLYNG